jgi:transcription antitermination factor NusG
MEIEKKWYAIYSKPRWEKKVDILLQKRNIISWCPVQKVEKQWSDRKKVVEEPLFRSYVFIRIDIKTTEKLNVLTTDGVLNFVNYLGKPAVIRDEEMELIRKYLAEKDVKIEILSMEGYKENMEVKVNQGVFMDKTGKIIHGGRKKVYVQLQSLGHVMIVEFPVEHLSLTQ